MTKPSLDNSKVGHMTPKHYIYCSSLCGDMWLNAVNLYIWITYVAELWILYGIYFMCSFIGLFTGMFYGLLFMKCIAELCLWKYNMN